MITNHLLLLSSNLIFFFFEYRQKYPDFVHYVSDEMETMTCSICSEYLEKDRIVITNPCSHFLCPECACEFGEMMEEKKRSVQCAGVI